MTDPSLRGRALTALGALALIAGLLVPTAQTPAAATSCAASGPATEYGGGDGSSGDPYLITNEAQLLRLSATPADWGEDFEQTANLDLTGCTWNPIGDYDVYFEGTYDGGGFRITGLTMDSDAQWLGLFGYAEEATLMDIHLVDVDLKGTNDAGTAGALVAEIEESTVERSSASGVIDTVAQGAGGLVGYDFGGSTISESFAAVAVTGLLSVGGLVGASDGSSIIKNSYARGSVTGVCDPGDSGSFPPSEVGGLIGVIYYGNGEILNSYSTGTVTADLTVTGCDPTTFVDPVANFGGLLGLDDEDDATITSSYYENEPAIVTIDATGDSTSSSRYGTASTTADMQLLATFAGWDIAATCEVVGDSIWGICSTINDGYPFLRNAMAAPESSDDDDDGDSNDSNDSNDTNGNGDSGNGNGEGQSGQAGNGTNGNGDGSDGNDDDQSDENGSDDGSAPVRADRVLVGGVVPSVPAGAGVWVRADGTEVALEVSSPEAGQVRFEGDGVQVTFTGAEGTSASAGLVADENGEVVCEICTELAAGDVASVWMFSTPRFLGEHVIEDLPCQRFTVSLKDPADGEGPAVAGAHTLQLAFPVDGGTEAVNVGLTVGGPVPSDVPAGEGAPLGMWWLAGVLAGGLLLARGVRRSDATV